MLSKIFKDPLIHFMVMGALIFAFFYARQDETSVIVDNVIEITEADIEAGLDPQLDKAVEILTESP